MVLHKSLRDELDALRHELSQLRKPEGDSAPPHAAPAADEPDDMSSQFSELNRLARQMLDEAEQTIHEHPVATVAGALALGIVIGRLTAR